MKKYSVEVVRTSYCSKTFEIEAENDEMARKAASEMAYDTDFSGREFDCDYEVLDPMEIKEENNYVDPNYIDRNGEPYDPEDDEHCWPAGGGLHKDCEYNADALYAYYVIKDRDKIFIYLSNKCFNLVSYCPGEIEVWKKGNTEITFEDYDKSEHLWGYMHTELIKE